MKRFALALSLVAFAACERRQTVEEPPPIRTNEHDSIMVVLLDMSGSYEEDLERRAFPLFARAVDSFFRDRIGSGDNTDRLVIAQISGGVTKSLLWDGSPRAFKREFGSAGAFRNYLRKKADTRGSRCFGGLADSLEYLLAYPGVAAKKTKTSVFVFSDMDDNDPKGDHEKARLLKLLSEYSKVRGCVGMYWVDDHAIWRKHLQDSGVEHYQVHSRIVADPPLPSWSD